MSWICIEYVICVNVGRNDVESVNFNTFPQEHNLAQIETTCLSVRPWEMRTRHEVWWMGSAQAIRRRWCNYSWFGARTALNIALKLALVVLLTMSKHMERYFCRSAILSISKNITVTVYYFRCKLTQLCRQAFWVSWESSAFSILEINVCVRWCEVLIKMCRKGNSYVILDTTHSVNWFVFNIGKVILSPSLKEKRSLIVVSPWSLISRELLWIQFASPTMSKSIAFMGYL